MSEEKKKLEDFPLIDGNYQTTLTEKYRRRRKYTPANPNHILSYIPGVVVSLGVQPGQQVRQGGELMLYKAMKMENRITSPVSGTVKAVHVSVGENLPKGALMIEFE